VLNDTSIGSALTEDLRRQMSGSAGPRLISSDAQALDLRDLNADMV